jgi:hydrogenase/urease accessory protein HupE
VVVDFGGTRIEPELTWRVAPATATGASPIATIRLTGDVPAAAGPLTWKYLWTFTAYSLTDRRVAEGAATQWLEGDKNSPPLSLDISSPNDSRLALVGQYVVLGFTHILPKGLDHVLFVLGIFLVGRRLRPILLQVTAFTIAHSITLALSITGIFTLPASIVEPAIAFSIAYIAIENVVVKDLRPWRYGMVFGFGLLHGLGFAGVLRELGLPPSAFVPALFGFNVGVELGQLTVIGAAFLMVGVWFRDRTWYRSRVVLPASVMIACAGLYWTLERLNVIA